MFSKWRFPDFPWKQLGYHQNILPYHWLTGMICGKMMVKWWVKHVLHSIWSDLQQLLEKCCILRHTIHGRDRPFPLLPPWSRADAVAQTPRRQNFWTRRQTATLARMTAPCCRAMQKCWRCHFDHLTAIWFCTSMNWNMYTIIYGCLCCTRSLYTQYM